MMNRVLKGGRIILAAFRHCVRAFLGQQRRDISGAGCFGKDGCASSRGRMMPRI
ncbi:MAG TPA: hypothetical protein VEB21_03615 [Terriglobales bacterium]|nr:hypothetical protein [Terriglobales bacterium]